MLLGMLVPVGGGDPIPLYKPKLIVGSASGCDIRLDFANVPARLCRLDYIDGYWRVTDVGNGTKVDGARIDEKFLRPGDTISLAQYAFEIQFTPGV